MSVDGRSNTAGPLTWRDIPTSGESADRIEGVADCRRTLPPGVWSALCRENLPDDARGGMLRSLSSLSAEERPSCPPVRGRDPADESDARDAGLPKSIEAEDTPKLSLEDISASLPDDPVDIDLRRPADIDRTRTSLSSAELASAPLPPPIAIARAAASWSAKLPSPDGAVCTEPQSRNESWDDCMLPPVRLSPVPAPAPVCRPALLCALLCRVEGV